LTEQPTQPQLTGWQREVVLFLDRQVYHLARHWLAAFNVLTGLYVLLPVLAPVFMSLGMPQVGRLVYLVYRPACHQLPERSVFLFGAQTTYTLEELWALGAVSQTDDIYARRLFLGNLQVGYKAALCQRDLALYGSLLLGGLVFGLLRKRLRPLSLLGYALCLVPMALDGGTQLIGLRQSTPLLRLITGSILGLGSVWMLYPRLEEAFQDVRHQANQRVHLDP
jgi:uncharacterized membrane protein